MILINNNGSLVDYTGESGQAADFIGATSSAAGAHGLVPAPAIADRNKFLKGNGTWATVEGGSGSYEAKYEEFAAALESHSIEDLLYIEDHIYKVTKTINANDPITTTGTGANITAETGLAEGAAINVEGIPDGGSETGGLRIVKADGTLMPYRSSLQFGDGFNLASDANKNIITPNTGILAKQTELSDMVLTGTKPSSAITKGKYFVDKNGTFRVATSNISTSTDVSDSNSTVKNIGDVLSQLNSDTTKFFKLVWTNPNPDASQAAGTVNLDQSLSGYSFIGVRYDNQVHIIPINTRLTLETIFFYQTVQVCYRVVTVTETTFNNEGAYQNGSSANERVIVTHIYGIK